MTSETSTNIGFLSIKISIKGLLFSASFLCILLTILSELGFVWWGFELASHFRPQYMLVLLALSGLALVTKSYKNGFFLLFFALLNMAAIILLFVSEADNFESNKNSVAFRVMHINIETNNREFELVKNEINLHDPDIFVLAETTAIWKSELASLNSKYPNHLFSKKEGCFGILLFSKFPLINKKIELIGNMQLPTLIVQFELQGQKINLLTTHPYPPIGKAGSIRRNHHLDRVAEIINGLDGHKILLGDLNMTPFSYIFDKFLEKTSLKDSERGFGLQASWPAWKYYFSPFLIPIDHCFLSDKISVTKRKIGNHVASDHYPLILDLTIYGN